MTHAQFLAKIKPGCFLVYKEVNILPSIAAAQTILESGWGSNGLLATQHNNYWGIKSFNTSEPRVLVNTIEYANGVPYRTMAYFRTYKSLEDGFRNGYIKVIGASRYSKARGVKDPRLAITYIIQGNYASDPSYVSTIMGIIKSNGLEKWDKEAIAGGDGGSGSFEAGALDFYTFNTNPIEKNKYTRPGFPLKGVVGVVLKDAGSIGAGLKTVRSHLEKGNGGNLGGCHILIDDKDTECIVPLTEAVYHSDAKKNNIDRLSASSKEYPNGNMNLNTISIGICRDSNGRFPDATSARVIAVLSELLNHYNLPIESVYRKLDVDGSPDPTPYYANMMDYSTLLGLVKYQRNQNTPLMNEDLIKLIEEQKNMQEDTGGGGAPMGTELVAATSGTRAKILKLAFEMKTWGLTYSQSRRNRIYKNGYSDCSSFTQYVYRHAAGIDIGINTWAQWARGVKVPRAATLPGDLAHWYEHVGILTDKGGNWVIHSGVGNSGFTYATDSIRQSRDSIQHMRTDYMGLVLKGYRSYVSEKGDPDGGSAGDISGLGGSAGSTTELDYSKQYYIDIKSSINSYNADSDRGTSVKRLAKGTKLKVLSIGAFAFRVGDREWVKKSDSSSFDLRATDKKDAPIGEAVIIGYAEAKTQPSLASASVLEQGKAKVYQQETTVSVYGARNGLLLVSPPGASEEYIPQASTRMASFLEDMPLYTDRQDDEWNNVSQGRAMRVKAELVKSDYDPLTGRLTIAGTMACHPKSITSGSTVEMKVPSLPSYNGSYFTGGFHELDEDVIVLYFDDPVDVARFGERAAEVKVVSRGI